MPSLLFLRLNIEGSNPALNFEHFIRSDYRDFRVQYVFTRVGCAVFIRTRY